MAALACTAANVMIIPQLRDTFLTCNLPVQCAEIECRCWRKHGLHHLMELSLSVLILQLDLAEVTCLFYGGLYLTPFGLQCLGAARILGAPNLLPFKGVPSPPSCCFRGYFHPTFSKVEGITPQKCVLCVSQKKCEWFQSCQSFTSL